MMKKYSLLLLLFSPLLLLCQEVAILKYGGGGDWYSNPTAVPNLIAYANQNTNTVILKDPKTVAVNSEDLFNFPIVFMTGHGNVFFSEQEAKNLRNYLISGGFIHISDNYGMDKFIRKELKKVFPELELVEIPNNHPIYDQSFQFPEGIPKIHEHDKKAPQGFGLFYQGRLICFYDFESDLSDGWEDATIHNDPEEVRLKALRMGTNILEYVFKN